MNGTKPYELYVVRVVRTPYVGKERHWFQAVGTGYMTSLCGHVSPHRGIEPAGTLDEAAAPNCRTCIRRLYAQAALAIALIDDPTSRRLSAALVRASLQYAQGENDDDHEGVDERGAAVERTGPDR